MVWKPFDTVHRDKDGKHIVSFGYLHPILLNKFVLGINHRITPNHHDYFEIASIVQGSGWCEIGSYRKDVKKGDILYIGPYDLHTFWSDPEDPLYLHTLYFERKMVTDPLSPDPVNEQYLETFFLENTSLRHIAENRSVQQGISHRLDEMLRIEDRGIDRLLQQKPLLLDILLLIRGLYRKELPGLSKDVTPFSSFFPLFRYVQDHYPYPISLDDAASVSCMSKYHFCRKFKKTLGYTFTEFVNRNRIDAAKQMLKETDHTVTYISREAGFNNLSHFNQCFKKYTLSTPREFRKRSRMESQ